NLTKENRQMLCFEMQIHESTRRPSGHRGGCCRACSLITNPARSRDESKGGRFADARVGSISVGQDLSLNGGAMVDSEWNSSRDGQEIWSAVDYRVGNGSYRCHGAEADFPGVFLSFQSYLRRAWQNTWSVQSADGRKDPPRLAPL